MSRYDFVLIHPPIYIDFLKASSISRPISDSVPSTSAFEMYPIGFLSILDFLEQRGMRVRIVNLPLKMMKQRFFNVREFIKGLDADAYGLDFHWLVHLRGMIETARLIKEYHSDRSVIVGGISATYFHKDLMLYPEIDYVIRGDCTENTIYQLLAALKNKSAINDIPDVTWRKDNEVICNREGNPPENLDEFHTDYWRLVKNSIMHIDPYGYLPYPDWYRRPSAAAFCARGCIEECIHCGGSRSAMKRLYGRSSPIFKSPHFLAEELWNGGRLIKGPLFLGGDITHGGMDYAYRVLKNLRSHKITNHIIVEFSRPVSQEFLKELASSVSGFTIQFSPETHDEDIRMTMGRRFSNDAMYRFLDDAKSAGCRNVKLFFMIGIPGQTRDSIIETVNFCGRMIKQYGRGFIYPAITPMAPFLDPASIAYEEPDKYGFRLFYRGLDDYYNIMDKPTWKDMLNYETHSMTREDIVNATYEAYIRLNLIKADNGLLKKPISERLNGELEREWHSVISGAPLLPSKTSRGTDMSGLYAQSELQLGGIRFISAGMRLAPMIVKEFMKFLKK